MVFPSILALALAQQDEQGQIGKLVMQVIVPPHLVKAANPNIPLPTLLRARARAHDHDHAHPPQQNPVRRTIHAHLAAA